MREGIALHILKLKCKCRTMLSMRRFVCTFCYKSILFFFKKGAASGKKFTLQNVFFSSVIIEAGEACKKCSVM